MQVRSLRNVGAVKGYPYFAIGLYEPKARGRDGKMTYRLIASGPRSRSSNPKFTDAFPDVPYVPNIRHGSPA